MYYKKADTYVLPLHFPHPYKNRSFFPITPPQFALFYRTSSQLITVPQVLPLQAKRICVRRGVPFV